MTQSVVRTAVLALAVSFVPAVSQAGVILSITVAPPVLPVYVQPVCPEVGLLWTPGYWAYGEAGYFWVPGVWMSPPSVGLLWTPGYWGWNSGVYAWNAGYWGPHVGFYGGVNYGFGYGGVGFLGGRWEGGRFAYNSAVMNVGVGFHSYHENVVVNNVHTSFNGGSGGIRASANADERRAMGEHHVGPTAAQNSHHEMAGRDRNNFASVNHGRPSNAAMSRPHAAGGAGHAENHAGANHAENHAGGAKAAEHKAGPANHAGAGASHAGAENHAGGAKAAEHKAGGAPANHAGGAAPHNAGGANKGGGGGGASKGGGGSHPAGKK
jgi:WXXGXW repeat (2 copies)